MDQIKDSKNCLTIETQDVALFGFILQQGFGLSVRTGCSLKDMLCDQFGIDTDYIDARIKTVFINGKPVDDYATAIVTDRAVLALSAAMPGLVGATFRSGGILSPFRSGISFANNGDTCNGHSDDGRITVKLFNLLIKEIGYRFLENGIWLSKETIKDLISFCGSNLKNNLHQVFFNNRNIDLDQIDGILANMDPGEVLLCVRQASS